MTYSVDPGFIDYYRQFSTMTQGGTQFVQLMGLMQLRLHQILKDNNMTIIELYKAMAIKCNEFVFFCEIHRKFYITPAMDTSGAFNNSCCDGNYFNSEPIFTNEGTCFTTTKEILETVPAASSSPLKASRREAWRAGASGASELACRARVNASTARSASIASRP